MRTAPMGPSNGMPDSINAAEAPFRARTSCGFSMSAPMTVPTMCTSLRNPSGNIGRSGRSMRRQVRIADSGARPSRRKNEPGILPAAYIRSSMSTVSGKKLAPGRGDLAPVAVTRTVDLPICASTAPSARPARRPTSNDIVFSDPLKVRDTVFTSVIVSSLDPGWNSSGRDDGRSLRQTGQPLASSLQLDTSRPGHPRGRNLSSGMQLALMTSGTRGRRIGCRFRWSGPPTGIWTAVWPPYPRYLAYRRSPNLAMIAR